VRVVFFGTPEFAVPSLGALIDNHEIVLVVSQPDRPAGRGMRLRRSPVAQLAASARIPLLLPQRVRDPEVLQAVKAAAPNIVVVAAYGQILPPGLLQVAPQGAINVHASLLPRWRGAAPVAAAILAGDDKTGVSIMQMEEGLDTGAVLLQRDVAIEDGETASHLSDRLARVGAAVLLEALERIESGRATAERQDDNAATSAPRVRKQNGDLEWSEPGMLIERALRAFDPWPGVRLPLAGDRIRVLRGRRVPDGDGDDKTPWSVGDVIEINDEGIVVMAGDGPFLLQEVQPPGKRPMSAAEFSRGRRDLALRK